MTTPTFRDWTEMYERASWEFIEYDDVWSEEFLLYILSRIERKEKAWGEVLRRHRERECMKKEEFDALPDYIKEGHYIESNADLKAMGIFVAGWIVVVVILYLVGLIL